MTAKNVLKLNAKYVTIFFKFILEIKINLNTSVLTATRPCTYGNHARMFPYTNAAMTSVPFFYLTKTNLIALKNFYPKLSPLNLNLDINTESIIFPMNNWLSQPLKILLLYSISAILLILFAWPLPSIYLSGFPPEKPLLS